MDKCKYITSYLRGIVLGISFKLDMQFNVYFMCTFNVTKILATTIH